MTNEHTSLENVPLTLYSWKGCERADVGSVWELSCRRNRLPHIDTKFLCITAALLSHSAGLLNWGPEGPSPLSGAGSHFSTFSPTTTETRTVTATRIELCQPRTPTQLKPSVSPSYIIVLRPPAFCGRTHLHRIQPVHRSRWYSDIFDRMHLFLDWRLGQGSI